MRCPRFVPLWSSGCGGWTSIAHPEGGGSPSTGDYRCGNFLVGPEGLRAVLDWELAHGGDPAEDIGWLCAPAWRFGGSGEVGGFGDLDQLLEAYAAAGGDTIAPDVVKWWQVYATVKWATICVMQASAHLSGMTRSVELATIGRRVCESEWDLFVLLGIEPDGPAPEELVSPSTVTSPFGRPTAAELVEAVREYVEGTVMEQSQGGARFEARIARNALQTVERQLSLGPAIADGASPIASRGWASPTMPDWPRKYEAATLWISGVWLGPPWPRRPGISCWWPTRPTCLPRWRRPLSTSGVRVSASARGRRGMPCNTAPVARLQATMKSQAWWNAVDTGVAGGRADDGHQAGHAEGQPDLPAHGIERGTGGGTFRWEWRGGGSTQRGKHHADAETGEDAARQVGPEVVGREPDAADPPQATAGKEHRADGTDETVPEAGAQQPAREGGEGGDQWSGGDHEPRPQH